jgi:hypothetical protein
MAEEILYVWIQVAQGSSINKPIMAQLIYEAGQPFALLSPDRDASLPEN